MYLAGKDRPVRQYTIFSNFYYYFCTDYQARVAEW